MTRDGMEERIRDLLPDLLAYFLRRASTPDDAADLVSETLLVLWRRRGSAPDGDDGLRRYAFGIARHVLQQSRRGARRRERLAERVGGELSVALRVADPTTRGIDPDLEAALGALAERDRELVALIVWDGFGVAEAGAIIGLRPDAARARYSRVRTRLRSALASSERSPRTAEAR